MFSGKSKIILPHLIGLIFLFTQALDAQIIKTVGTTGADYSTLKESFDAINAGTLTGSITLRIIDSTTESSTASLNASGTGSASYTSVTIYPTSTGKKISGNLAAPLISLNGADNVTIDGRVNQTGNTKDLVISNSSNSDNSSTSTIRFYNGAINNTIKYCTIKGSTTDGSAGVIFFGTSIANTGNVIDNNNLTNSSDETRPINTIYSEGAENTITISNNHIYDFLSHNNHSYGINLNNGTGVCTISGNSFFETTTFVPTGYGNYYPIHINTTSAGYLISGNYIGGSAPNCVGTWVKTNATYNGIYAMWLESVGTGVSTIIKGNTINGFNWGESYSNGWMGGINVGSGDATIGVEGEPNTIGSITGTPNMTFTFDYSATVVTPIVYGGSGYITCQYNNIGGITCNNTDTTMVTRFICIYRGNNNASGIISNNTIGSSTNPIRCTSPSIGDWQYMVGILNSGGASTGLTVSNNTISHIYNSNTNVGYVCGFHSYDAPAVLNVSNNSIHDLTIANTNSGSGRDASIKGGIFITSGYLATITNNTIYNLINTNRTFNGHLYGINCFAGNGANECSGNTVYNIKATGTGAGPFIYGIYFGAYLGGNNTISKNYIYGLNSAGVSDYAWNTRYYGIYKQYSPIATLSNNIITLGGDNQSTIFGIYDEGNSGSNSILYHNTVYVSGTPTTGGLNSYTYYIANNNARTVKNNIFYNARISNGTWGNHYSAYFASSEIGTLDYNDYYAPAPSGYIMFRNDTYYTTLSSWQTSTGSDENSVQTDPSFKNPIGILAGDYEAGSYMPGSAGTGITTDYSGKIRSATSPNMGAFELSAPRLLSPVSGSVGNPVNLNLVWSKPQGYTVFHLKVSSDSAFTNLIVNDSTLTDSVKALSGLTPLTTYFWKVKVKSSAGWSPYSSTFNFKVSGSPYPVTLYNPEENATEQPTNLTFQWSKAVNQTLNKKSQSNNYWYELATDTSFNSIVTRDTLLTDTTKIVNSLNYETNYFWRVKAKNSIGWGEFSPIWKFTTKSQPAVILTASQGTASGEYQTLKAAFDEINAGTHKGIIAIKIALSTTETNTAILDANGSGSASYTSINIYPSATGLSITGNLSAPLISLNGANNVTIDGRVNQTGSVPDLIISNANTSSTAGTSTINLENGAHENKISYCNLKGSETVSWDGYNLTTTGGGIILLSTSNSTLGNSNNSITYNNFTNAGGNRPNCAITSIGTIDKNNAGDTIANNNFYDCMNLSSNYAITINLVNYSTEWVIKNNSIYETSPIVPTGNGTAVFINLNSGDGHTVTGNYMGGSAPQCGGVNPMTKTNANDNSLWAVNGAMSPNNTTTFRNNYIQNIDWSNSGASQFLGFNCNGKLIIDGNKIGDSTGTGNIKFTNAASGGLFIGMNLNANVFSVITNNVIGSITTNNTSTNSIPFYGVKTSGSADYNIINNKIGSTSTANSINMFSASTSYQQDGYAINIGNAAVDTISNNIISNITNNTTNTTTGGVYGIAVTSGSNIITNNDISNLKTSASHYSSSNASVNGIWISNSGAYYQKVSNNSIYSLTNTNSTLSGNVIGIYYYGGSVAGQISNNYIHNFSIRDNSITQVDGIYAAGGNATYHNNIINISFNNAAAIAGIQDAGGTNNFYFNTVYIGGSPVSTNTSTYAFWNNNASSALNYRNNTFINARTNNGSTGYHFAVRLSATPSTINYNNYYAGGNGGALGYYNGIKYSLSEWQTATGQDVNSLNNNPYFYNPGGGLTTDFEPGVAMFGIAITGYTIDYRGTTRSTVPTMGAYEFRGASLLSPSSNSTGNPLSLNLVWSKPSGASKYHIMLSTDSNFTTTIINDTTLTDTIKSVSNLSPYTKYFWKARAYTLLGWSPYSGPFNFKTMGSATQVVLASPSNNSINQPANITFSWYKAGNITLSKGNSDKLNEKGENDNPYPPMIYWYEISTDSTFASVFLRDTTLTDTTKSVSGLAYNVIYYWRVKAKNTINYGSFSSVWKLTTINPTPNAPALISPANGTSGAPLSLNLIWNKPQFANTYNVVIATDSGFTNIVLNDSTLTDSVKALSNLTPLTTYYWKVRAKSISGWGGFSSIFNLRTIGVPNQVILSTPVNNAVNQSLSLSFKWFKSIEQTESPTGNASTYWFELATDTTFTTLINRDTILTDTNKTISGLSYVTAYYWRVKAKGSIGWGNFSSVWKFTTTVPVPAVPSLISPVNGTIDLSTTPELNWSDVQYATSYRVQVSNSSVFTTTVYDSAGLSVSGVNIPSGKLLTNTQYFWRVNATNSSGTSSYSSGWSFTTAPSIPNVPVLCYPANGSSNNPLTLTFKWYKALEIPSESKTVKDTNTNEYGSDNNKTVSKYWFEISLDRTFTSPIIDSTLSGADTTLEVSNLSSTTKYYWRVKAKNQTGWGEFSAVWSFETLLPIPSAPVLSLPANNSTGVPLTPALIWGTTPHASSYRIQISTDTGFTSTAFDTSGVTETTINIPESRLTGLTKYYWRVNATNVSGTGNWSSVWKFTTLQYLPVSLKVYFEGFWDGSTQLTDTARIYLASPTAPYALVDSATVVFSTSGTATMNFTKVTNGSYYIVVSHRNHLETWSKLPQALTTNTPKNYDFTTSASQAYGDNMKQVGSVWALYGGDVNMDGSVDAIDVSLFIPQFGNSGYLSGDLNGDGSVDALDVPIMIANFGLGKAVPTLATLPPEKGKTEKVKEDIQTKYKLNGTDIKKDNNKGKNN